MRSGAAGLWLDRLGTRVVTLRRASVYATITIALFALVYAFGLVRRRGLVNGFGQVIGGDFLTLRLAAQMIRDGNGARLYDFGLQAAYQAAALAPEKLPGLNPFVAPPFVALFFLPWTFVSHFVGFVLWTSLALACVPVSLRLICRVPETRTVHRAIVLIAFSFLPVIEGAEAGNNAIVSLLVFSVILASLRSGHDGLGGAALALQLSRPQLVAVPLVVLLAKRRWRAVAGFAAGAAVLAGLSIVFVAPGSLLAWARLTPALSRMIFEPGMPFAIFSSVYALFQLPLGPEHFSLGTAAGTVLSLALVGGLLWFWSGPWRPGDADFDLRFAAMLAVAPLTSPYLQLHDLSILVVAAVLVLGQLADGTVRLSLALVWFACMIGPAVTSRIVRVPLPPIAILLAAVVVAASWRRATDTASPGSPFALQRAES
jgi:glycosyl transferase family 87